VTRPTGPPNGGRGLTLACIQNLRALIAAALREGLASWEENHVSITTDNTSNMVTAARFNEWTGLQCLLSLY